MERFFCREVKNAVRQLMSAEKLKGKIFVAGGIVPWLLSGRDSNRMHGDVDLVVEKGNMELVREYLKEQRLYRPELDSLSLACNPMGWDHGVEAYILQVPMNFAPFEVNGDGIVQRNFTLEQLAGFDSLMIATLEHIALEDYLTTYVLSDGTELGAYTLEAVRAAKETSDREKDLSDLKEISRIGVSLARYARVKRPIQTMKIDFVAEH